MLLVTARLPFISEDIWYTCLPNDHHIFQLLEYYSVTQKQLTSQDLQLIIDTEHECICKINNM